jgi:hypothetical protein
MPCHSLIIRGSIMDSWYATAIPASIALAIVGYGLFAAYM